MVRSWPPNWDALVAGEGCEVCAVVRGETSSGDPRIYESPTSSALLVSRDIQRGYVIVSCRRHVVEPFELPDAEAAAYRADILRVGRALHEHYGPKKLNYETWGNGQPHLHTHIVPRYEVDPHPGGGFPFWEVRDPPPIPQEQLASDADALRALLSWRESHRR